MNAIENAEYSALTDRERALIDYAITLTAAPADISRDDIERLRACGLDDVGILHTCEIVAYFNFVNRLAHGLGVELES